MTSDPKRLAAFWADALRLSERRDEANETIVADGEWTYPRLTFQKVTDSSARARQLHLDLTADDRRVEVERLCDLGAREQRSVTGEGNWTWTVRTDPDGNEFCITDP